MLLMQIIDLKKKVSFVAIRNYEQSKLLLLWNVLGYLDNNDNLTLTPNKQETA